MRSIPALAVAFVVAVVTLAPGVARAEDEYDVSIASGTLTVKPRAGWHMNLKYPWKLTIAGTAVDKAKFTIEEAGVKIADAPKGHGTLKGAVCSGDSCKTFEKEVDVN